MKAVSYTHLDVYKRQLLYGLMIPSGNDAANAIADHIAGSTDAFVEKMNAKEMCIRDRKNGDGGDNNAEAAD